MKPVIQGGNRGLVSWITRNYRKSNGKTDWERIAEVLNTIYPSTLNYTDKRAPFTIEFALEKCRELAQEMIQEKGIWNPMGINARD